MISEEIKIPNSNLTIGGGKVFIIAEIGKNFIQTENNRPLTEYLKNAKELIGLAKEAGADAVKFQTHNLEDEQLDISVVSPHFKGADRYSWVKRNTEATPLEFWTEIKEYCDKLGILFFSTPMSRGAAKKLAQVGVDLWKIGSGDILDFVALDYLARSGKPIIISSGMSTLEETDKAVKFLKIRNAKTALLHCVSKYPCPASELRLSTMNFFKKRYNMPIGFSDHSISITPSVVAVALGAEIIEKHFSLDRGLWGSDHKASLTPSEFKELCQSVRLLESRVELKQKIAYSYKLNIFENEEKVLQDDEAVFRPYFRKSLMAARDLKAGEIIAPDMVYAMRPQCFAGGLPSEEYENIIGRKIAVDLKKYDPITKNVV
ncbi:MAG: N-acetylneuraminate synthase family protein [Patescibacteria group bacterium]